MHRPRWPTAGGRRPPSGARAGILARVNPDDARLAAFLVERGVVTREQVAWLVQAGG